MVSNLLDEAQDNPGHSPAHIRETFPWSPRSLGLIECRTPLPWPSPARSRPSLEQVNWVTVPHSKQRSSFLVRSCVLSHFSRVQLFVTLWTVAYQAPRSMEFSRQEYWSGLPCPPPGDLFDPGIEPSSFISPTLAGGVFTTSTTWEALELLSVQFSHAVMSDLSDPMDCSTPGFPIHHQLPELAQIHVH